MRPRVQVQKTALNLLDHHVAASQRYTLHLDQEVERLQLEKIKIEAIPWKNSWSHLIAKRLARYKNGTLLCHCNTPDGHIERLLKIYHQWIKIQYYTKEAATAGK